MTKKIKDRIGLGMIFAAVHGGIFWRIVDRYGWTEGILSVAVLLTLTVGFWIFLMDKDIYQ